MPLDESRGFVRKALGAKESLGFEASLAYLRQQAGSGRGAARLAGVDEAQLRRWARGSTPSAASREKVERAARDARTPAAQADARFAPTLFRQERRRERRELPVKAGKLQLAEGTLEKARSTYVATGDADAAFKVFIKGIGDQWYRDSLIPPEWRNEEFDYDYLDSDYLASF